MDDRARFVDPWTLLLPDRFPCVLGVAGSGGRTTLLLRLWRHFRDAGASVMWASTFEQAPPFDLLPARCGPDATAIRARLEEEGQAWVGGAASGEGRYEGLAPRVLEELRRAARPDVLLVDAQDSCGTPLRRDGSKPTWPMHVQLAFLVGSLGAVGRLWGPAAVAGVESDEVSAEGEPRRVDVDDVLQPFLASDGLVAGVPGGALPLPFFTGLAQLRDIDGMFGLVEKLWTEPGVKAVCLGDLLGDARRDAADQAGLDLERVPGPWSGERIYAVYPASLDGPEASPD